MVDQIKGMAELSKKLKALGPVVGGKALRSAVNFGLTPVVKEAQASIPKGDTPHKTYKGRVVAPGFASRNIVKRTRLDKRNGVVRGNVGVRDEAFYATQFVEIGTSKMRAQPWLRPAFKAKRREMLDRAGSKLKKNIEKVAKQ